MSGPCFAPESANMAQESLTRRVLRVWVRLRGASSEGPLAWPVLRVWVRLRGASSEGPLAWLGPLAGAYPGPVRHLSGLCPVLVRGLVGLS